MKTYKIEKDCYVPLPKGMSIDQVLSFYTYLLDNFYCREVTEEWLTTIANRFIGKWGEEQ